VSAKKCRMGFKVGLVARGSGTVRTLLRASSPSRCAPVVLFVQDLLLARFVCFILFPSFSVFSFFFFLLAFYLFRTAVTFLTPSCFCPERASWTRRAGAISGLPVRNRPALISTRNPHRSVWLYSTRRLWHDRSPDKARVLSARVAEEAADPGDGIPWRLVNPGSDRSY